MSQETKEKIAKLQKAIDSPATPENVRNSLKKALEKLQAEIISHDMEKFKEGDLKTSTGKTVTDASQAKAIAMSEAGKSKKKAKKAAPKKAAKKQYATADMGKLKALINSLKNKKGYEFLKKLDLDSIKRDSERKAKKAGKRVSKSGNVYYEYRRNRTDVNGKIKLKEGGEIETASATKQKKLWIEGKEKEAWSLFLEGGNKYNYTFESYKKLMDRMLSSKKKITKASEISHKEYEKALNDYDKWGAFLEDAETKEDKEKYRKLMKEAESIIHRAERPELYAEGGEVGVDLFETPEKIPANVQKVLDKYEDGFIDGSYTELKKANNELKKIGYTFEYYLDGSAYDLRKIGEKGKSEE